MFKYKCLKRSVCIPTSFVWGRAKLAVMQMCYLVTSPRYRRKGGTSSKAFQAVQEQCFYGGRVTLGFVTVQTFKWELMCFLQVQPVDYGSAKKQRGKLLYSLEYNNAQSEVIKPAVYGAAYPTTEPPL